MKKRNIFFTLMCLCISPVVLANEPDIRGSSTTVPVTVRVYNALYLQEAADSKVTEGVATLPKSRVVYTVNDGIIQY